MLQQEKEQNTVCTKLPQLRAIYTVTELASVLVSYSGMAVHVISRIFRNRSQSTGQPM